MYLCVISSLIMNPPYQTREKKAHEWINLGTGQFQNIIFSFYVVGATPAPDSEETP